MSNTPSRAEWYGEYQANGKTATVETHVVFGWKVQRHVLPVGSVLVMVSANTVPRERAPNRAMYVRGLATCMNGDTSMGDRVPGMCSMERPDFPAGRSVITALEETEFWCFNYTMNRKSLPNLTPVRLGVGNSINLEAGTLLFAMSGTASGVVGPSCFVPDQSCTLTASTPFYGFIVAEAKS